MMGFWLPSARTGTVSTEYPGAPHPGADGWYLEIGWLGWMIEFSFASVHRSERRSAAYLRKWAEK